MIATRMLSLYSLSTWEATVISALSRFVGLLLLCCANTLLDAQGFRRNSKPFLSTGFINTEVNDGAARWQDPKWSSQVCSNAEWMKHTPPKFEWTPVISPSDEHSSIVGVSGIALRVHQSTADMPFTHPFGYDYNYLLVPDANYESLLASTNSTFSDPDRSQASLEAKGSGITVSKGFLAVEQDFGLVPPDYRVWT